MRWRSFILGLTVGFLAVPSTAGAIIIELKPGVRVSGFFVSDDGKTLVIANGPGTDAKRTAYNRSKDNIKIIHQLDRERLGQLTPADARAYCDYAAVLAIEKDDPEARHTARRLFFIAAHLKPQQFGPVALRGMSALARTPQEARKCLALAVLLDPKGDVNALKGDAVKPARLSKEQAALAPDFLKALKYYRTGDTRLAKDYATRQGMEKMFDLVPGMMDQKAFLQRCVDAGKGDHQTFPDDAMRIVIQAELWVIEQQASDKVGDKKKVRETNWSAILQARQVSPVLPLSLETLTTDFNPRNCYYRNGKWVEAP